MNGALAGRVRIVRGAALGVGVIGLAACGVGRVLEPRQFYASYLFGCLFWLGLALGCLTIVMIHHLTGGRWGYPIRRFLEAGFSTLPVMFLLFLPIFFGLRELYPWARPDALPRGGVRRLSYLAPGWFIARAVFCLALWSGMAWLLRRWSRAQDETTESAPSWRLRTLSGPGLLIYPLTATFVYIDWIMSLEKDWHSTIFAVIILSGQVLVAFAFATIMLRVFEAEELFGGAAKTLVYHQLGNLLLTFVLFWTYVSFSQLLIIYSANLPHEIAWYLHRIAGAWKFVIAAVAALHFLAPFILLLFRANKRNPAPLVGIAVLIFAMHLLAVYWLVLPSIHPRGLAVSWLDFAAPLGIGGVWVTVFFWLLMRAPLVPRNDPRMAEQVAYGAP